MKPDVEHTVQKDAVVTKILITQNPPLEQVIRSIAMHQVMRDTLSLEPMTIPEDLKFDIMSTCRG